LLDRPNARFERFRAEIRFSEGCRMAFGEIVAKQSQDNKPLPQKRFVRTASVGNGLRSRSPLRSRSGREVSGTRPLLSRLSPAPHIPARPFGLGWRFDVTLLVTPTSFGMRTFAPAVDQPAEAGPRYHTKRLIASVPRMGYMMPARTSDLAVVARHFEPRCATNPHRGFRALRAHAEPISINQRARHRA
jgi:hypothetical protein